MPLVTLDSTAGVALVGTIITALYVQPHAFISAEAINIPLHSMFGILNLQV
jgi:hypothetical protein